MFMIFLTLITVLPILSLIILFCGVYTPNRVGMLISDLGLRNPWWGRKTTAFYRWNWRKANRERVWAERIVKEAFHRAKVWLSSEDCEFFAQQCYEYSRNQKVDYEPIIQKVEQIVKRSDLYNQSVQRLVKEILHRIRSTPESEAVRRLQQTGVDIANQKSILLPFGIHEIRQTVERLAAQVLIGSRASDLETGTEHELLSQIQGPEGWQHWLHLFRSQLLLELDAASAKNDPVSKSLAVSVRGGLLQDFEEDMLDHLAFMESLENSITQRRVFLEADRIRDVEKILYTWQFNKAIPFTSADHRRIRFFLTRKDLCGHFQEIILSRLPADFESLGDLLNRFPRHVVFYGANATAREFAAEQYRLHVQELLDVFAPWSRQEVEAPAMLVIPAADIDTLVREKALERMRKPLHAGPTEEAVEWTRQALWEVIDQKKKRSIRKRKLDLESAEAKGWIINLAWDEQTTRIFEIFQNGPLDAYARFGSDGIIEVDFISERHEAKRQRWMFFKAVLDTLTGRALPEQAVEEADFVRELADRPA